MEIKSAALSGINAYVFSVDVQPGRPCLHPRPAAALRACGFNLGPYHASAEKDPALDLPVAVGMLAAAGELPADRVARHLFVGQLSLAGDLRPIRGALPMAMAAKAAGLGLVLPDQNLIEAEPSRAKLVPVSCLSDAVRYFRKEVGACELQARSPRQRPYPYRYGCFSEVRGQRLAKRALLVAAAGNHSALMIGPPGCGKTMLARRLAGILPQLNIWKSVEVTSAHSVAGLVPEGGGLMPYPPFRAPHHTISYAGMVGGGSPIRPGEVTLAHRGVLFLDELPEFSRQTMEGLRRPLEDGEVTILRRVTYPASFLLVGAMNPCPCGYGASSRRLCRCSGRDVFLYRSRVGCVGPFFDLHVKVEELSPSDEPGGPTTEEMRAAVVAARERQAERLAGTPHRTNAELPGDALDCFVRRGYPDGVRRVALTIADLAGSWSAPTDEHLEEAASLQVPEL